MIAVSHTFRTSALITFFSLFIVSASALAGEAGLEGNWQTGEDNSVVNVTGVEGVYTGKLVSSGNPKAKVGTEILRDVKQVDGVWKGSLYAPKRDKVMDATVTPASDVLTIKVSAGFIKKTVTWTRVAD